MIDEQGRERNAIAPARKPKAELRTPKVKRLVQFGPPSMTPVAPVIEEKAKIEKPKRVKTKNDPALAAKARELRDRWMEQLNRAAPVLSDGKYDVGRMLSKDEGRRMKMKGRRCRRCRRRRERWKSFFVGLKLPGSTQSE
jgi:hypothetical protein